MKEFRPDLIVEVTGVCDRACVGCYAPNLVSNTNGEEMYRARPEMFLKSDRLSEVLNEFNGNIDSIAIRGGEPSRHPYLADILRVAHEKSNQVYVETHAHWILDQNQSQSLLAACSELGTTIKISFDHMHGLSSEELKLITERLALSEVRWVVAITEENEEAFQLTRALCSWIPDKQIIFQKKATTMQELIVPKVGVIKLNGRFSRTFSVKSSFLLKPVLAGAGI
jgi:organic radical activating enzyme